MINIKKIQTEKSIPELLKFSLINIDKPSGPTSFTVSQYLKDSLKTTKSSHMGTLDPKVTGVLPISLGRACRLSDYFMHRDKTYVGIMRLHKEITETKLKETLKKFIGKITQTPPLRSNVKRAPRVREVKSFNILEIQGTDVLFETQVQAGTYIRTICDDAGKELGGAHMLELRRTQAGLFKEEDSITLYDFQKALDAYKEGNEKPLRKMLIPAEYISQILPVVQIQKQVVKKVLTGSPIFDSFLKDETQLKNLSKDDKIAVFENQTFIGCYKFIGKENIIATPEFVFN